MLTRALRCYITPLRKILEEWMKEWKKDTHSGYLILEVNFNFGLFECQCPLLDLFPRGWATIKLSLISEFDLMGEVRILQKCLKLKQDLGLQCQTSVRLKVVVKSIWPLFETKSLYEPNFHFVNLNLFFYPCFLELNI